MLQERVSRMCIETSSKINIEALIWRKYEQLSMCEDRLWSNNPPLFLLWNQPIQSSHTRFPSIMFLWKALLFNWFAANYHLLNQLLIYQTIKIPCKCLVPSYHKPQEHKFQRFTIVLDTTILSYAASPFSFCALYVLLCSANCMDITSRTPRRLLESCKQEQYT